MTAKLVSGSVLLLSLVLVAECQFPREYFPSDFIPAPGQDKNGTFTENGTNPCELPPKCHLPCPGAAPPLHCPSQPVSCPFSCACQHRCENGHSTGFIECYMTRHCDHWFKGPRTRHTTKTVDYNAWPRLGHILQQQNLQ